MSEKHCVVLALTGASGAAIGMRIAKRLAARENIRTALVVSDAARRTLAHEVDTSAHEALRALVDETHEADNIGATLASGSFRTAGMIIAPCSMRSLAAIAAGITDNLITRAADVHLKERRRLVLMARETPLHLGHIRNMATVTEMGAIVMPPVPAFYHRPQSLDDVIDHLAARAIDLINLPGPAEALAWEGKG